MSKQSKSKRLVRRLGALLLVILLLAAFVGYAWFKPLPAITLTAKTPVVAKIAPVNLAWPTFGQAAIGAVGYGVLATNGAQTALPTASIVKVMTALAVLKQKPLAAGQQGPVITLDQTDVDYYTSFVAQDGSVVAVAAGEQISEYQALQALLLPSANNIADSLARWAFGSVDSFNSYANAYAKQLGLSSMVITDPSGLNASTVASASDLVKLGEVALGDPVITEIIGQSKATIPVAGDIYNVNKLLGQAGTIGIKTGNNDADLGAYLFAARQTVGDKTITVIGAVMDGPSLPAALLASLPLIPTISQNFSQRAVVTPNTQLGWYDVPWQGKVAIKAAKPLGVLSWNAETPTLTRKSQSLAATAKAGQTVGTLTVTNPVDKTQSSSDLVLSQAITSPSLVWRLQHAL